MGARRAAVRGRAPLKGLPNLVHIDNFAMLPCVHMVMKAVL